MQCKLEVARARARARARTRVGRDSLPELKRGNEPRYQSMGGDWGSLYVQFRVSVPSFG
jgi:hypothetical protein